MLKKLLQKIIKEPSLERQRETLEKFGIIPRRIRTPEDAIYAGGLHPILPQSKTAHHDN